MARPSIAMSQAFKGVQAMTEPDIVRASRVEQTIERIIDLSSGCHSDLGAAARCAAGLWHGKSAMPNPRRALSRGDPGANWPADVPASRPVSHPPEVAR
jgi:hypothetical protein